MTKQRVSVAMCTYNGADYLRQQLLSIQDQSQRVDEIVICDDVSKDDTCRIVGDFSEQHPGLVRCYRNDTNLGYAQNFGKAISLCSGEIILLSDQDDIWLPAKVERMAAIFARDDDCGVVAGGAVITDQNLNSTGRTLSTGWQNPRVGAHTFSANIQRSFAYGCTLALRASLRPVILPISPRWGHDNWICFIASMFSEIQSIEEPLMLYRRHSASAGKNDKLDFGTPKQLLAAYKRGTGLDYQIDREQWQDMYDHLQKIVGGGLPSNASDEMSNRKAVVLDRVRTRLDFSKRRLEMIASPRPFRLLSAGRLLFSGQYHEFVSGWRSLARDLLVA
jgi:glycosyltransferase involved in cell wall biosynthesis